MPLIKPFVEFRSEETELSIPHRFERQAAKYPDELAIKAPTREITYGELNKSSNCLARAIIANRGEANEPIAMVLEHGPSSVIGFLAILKAGKICVPLNPANPPARLQYLVKDSQAGLVLEQGVTGRAGISDLGFETIDIDALSAEFSDSNLNLDLGPESLATILYTSGSTGQPKGVVQNHRNVLFEVRKLTNSFRISPNDRISHLLATSVAGGVREILSALLNGAVLLPFDIKRDGLAGLASWLDEEKITVCRTVSTTFRTFVGSLTAQKRFLNLRVLYVGGETVSKKDFESYQRHFPPECAFVNVYGATETGIVLQYFAGKNSKIESVTVPVGFPPEETEVLLLDESDQCVSLGQVGEITVKSRYLALGYWRQPALTEAEFANDPTGGDKRVYRTGDLGRLLSDGGIEYIGRKDFQAEIRGHRIEVAEVEAALLDLPSIKEATVTSRADSSGEQRLIAYVVAEKDMKPSVTNLHRALSARLPAYMVPSAFVIMDALPMIGIGKVDRSVLPEPDLSRPVLQKEFQAARSPLEVQLALVWTQVLGIFPIGINDNFFELGGNSLLAIQLIILVGEVFRKPLIPALLFQAPTIAKFADLLEMKNVASSSPSLIPIQTFGSKPPFFWIHGDSSNALLANYLGTDQPLYGLEHQSQDGRPADFTQVETIAAHYLSQIRMVQPKGPYFLGGYSFGGIVAFEIAQQLQIEGAHIPLLFIIDSHFPGTFVKESPGLDRSPSARDIFIRFCRDTRRHLRSMSGRTMQQKWHYVRIRVLDRLRFSTISKAVKTSVCSICLATRHPLPPSVRSHYILHIYEKAVRRYIAQPYAGQIIYVRSEQRSPQQHMANWRRVARNFELYEVPDCDHMSIIGQPHSHLWAKKLKECLQKVHGHLPDRIVSNPPARTENNPEDEYN
jgi:amino acid adenylation domain-containing protein